MNKRKSGVSGLFFELIGVAVLNQRFATAKKKELCGGCRRAPAECFSDMLCDFTVKLSFRVRLHLPRFVERDTSHQDMHAGGAVAA